MDAHKPLPVDAGAGAGADTREGDARERDAPTRIGAPPTINQDKWTRKSSRVEELSQVSWHVPVDAPLPYIDIINYSEARSWNHGMCAMCGRVQSTECVIPRQNKDICRDCDTAIWLNHRTSAVIKFCKGCKNFVQLAEFEDKPTAAKCSKCRQRGRANYIARKKLAVDKPTNMVGVQQTSTLWKRFPFGKAPIAPDHSVYSPQAQSWESTRWNSHNHPAFAPQAHPSMGFPSARHGNPELIHGNPTGMYPSLSSSGRAYQNINLQQAHSLGNPSSRFFNMSDDFRRGMPGPNLTPEHRMHANYGRWPFSVLGLNGTSMFKPTAGNRWSRDSTVCPTTPTNEDSEPVQQSMSCDGVSSDNEDDYQSVGSNSKRPAASITLAPAPKRQNSEDSLWVHPTPAPSSNSSESEPSPTHTDSEDANTESYICHSLSQAQVSSTSEIDRSSLEGFGKQAEREPQNWEWDPKSNPLMLFAMSVDAATSSSRENVLGAFPGTGSAALNYNEQHSVPSADQATTEVSEQFVPDATSSSADAGANSTTRHKHASLWMRSVGNALQTVTKRPVENSKICVAEKNSSSSTVSYGIGNTHVA